MNSLIKQLIESKFNFNIDIEPESVSKKSEFSKSDKSTKLQIDIYDAYHIWVDLGLPSKTLWCAYNLGVDLEFITKNKNNSKPEDWYGNYYSWGETQPKKKYTLKTYKFGDYNKGKQTKYNQKDGKKVMDLEDDPAYANRYQYIQNYQEYIHTPSVEQFEELIANTTNKWVENYNNIPGLNGRIFKSFKNKNSIFIPAAGWRPDTGEDVGKVILAGETASFWANDLWSYGLDDYTSGNTFGFGPHEYRKKYQSKSPDTNTSRRCLGFSIRPVVNFN